MNKFDRFPRLIRSFLMCSNSPVHSENYRLFPRPLGSIAYVLSGSAEYVTEDSSFKLSPGDILFIPVGGTYISYWSSPPKMLAMQFDMPLPEDRRYLVQRLSSSPDDPEDFAAVVDHEVGFDSLERFYRVCGRIWSRLETVATRRDPRIRPALERLETRIDQPVKVCELAALCHMSESHFYAVFRASLGVPPIEYRHRLLIGTAQRLLSSSELSIGEIAERLGFESETYFRRVFKSTVSVSPKKYRATMQM